MGQVKLRIIIMRVFRSCWNFHTAKRALSATCENSKWYYSMLFFVFSFSLFSFNSNYLTTESEVVTRKSQTEALLYWPSDSEVNTVGPGLRFSQTTERSRVLSSYYMAQTTIPFCLVFASPRSARGHYERIMPYNSVTISQSERAMLKRRKEEATLWACFCVSFQITYMKKWLHSDWLRAVQFFFKQYRKEFIQCKKRKQSKHSDWLMIKETQMANQIFCFQIKHTPWMAQLMAQFFPDYVIPVRLFCLTISKFFMYIIKK